MAATTVGQRFAQLIKELGLTKNAFAQSLGKTATVIQHLVDERNKPGYDLLCKVFEVYPNVSKDWLLLGQGAILLSARGGGSKVEPETSLKELTSSVAPAPEPAVEPGPAAVSPPAAPVADAAPAAEPKAVPVASAAPAALANNAAPESAPAPTPPALEAYVTAALHTQHLQHQLALAEQRNQHLLEQQKLLQQMLELARERPAA